LGITQNKSAEIQALQEESDIIEHSCAKFREESLIIARCEEILSQFCQTFSCVSLALVKQLQTGKTGRGHKYPEELKASALTLQIYSVKEYESVRKLSIFPCLIDHKYEDSIRKFQLAHVLQRKHSRLFDHKKKLEKARGQSNLFFNAR